MKTSTSRKASKKSALERTHHMSPAFLGTIAVGVLSIIASFGLGIKSAGELRTLEQSQAYLTGDLLGNGKGDIDGSGVLDNNDVMLILEASQNMITPSRDEILRGDTDNDFALTVKDALRVLHTIAEQ